MLKAATVNANRTFCRKLGIELSESLISKLGGQPVACWIFCSARDGMHELINGVADVMGSSALIGCTTDGEISSDGFGLGSVVLGGIMSEDVRVRLAFAKGLANNSELAGRELARQIGSDVRHLQIFTDGITENGCAILRGLRSVLGDGIPISGGAAGDSGKFSKTWQFIGSSLMSDSIVGIGLLGEFRLGAGVQSGWSAIGTAKKVTRASGNIVYELNGQPALEVYERFLGRHAADLPSVGVEYPFGFLKTSGDCGEESQIILRATMSVNRDQGSIVFAGEIPEGSMVRLTCGEYGAILDAARLAASNALAELGAAIPRVVFIYSCAARKIVLGRRTPEEINLVKSVLGLDTPMIGFYSYGEYCRPRYGAPSLFHNETATVTVLGNEAQ